MSATTPEVAHGYTMGACAELARKAAGSNKWAVSDFIIRYEAAWDAITEHLLTCEHWPSPHDLARVGKGAMMALLKDHCHTYGYADRDLTAGMGSAPRFAAYWSERGAPLLDERVTERVAAAQVYAVPEAVTTTGGVL